MTDKEMEIEQMLEERKHGLGGSDIAAVLGVSPWKTPLQLWEEKTGRNEEKQEDTPAMYWGRTLEDIVAKEFEKRIGKPVKSVPMSYRKDWRIANIDRLVGEDEVLECKTANAWSEHSWGASQEEEIKMGVVVSDHEIPIYYETQVQWYLYLTGFKRAYLAVLIGGQDYRIYQIDRDEELIQKLETEASAFWNNNVLKGEPPAPINEDDVKRMFLSGNGRFVEADNDTATTLGEMMNIKAQIDHLKKEYDAMKQVIVTRILENDGLTINGVKACTYKVSNRSHFDTDRFKAEHPNLWSEYSETLTTRSFRLY